MYKYTVTISDGHCNQSNEFLSESGIYSIKNLFDLLAYGTDLHLPPAQKEESPATPSNTARAEICPYRVKWAIVNASGETEYDFMACNK